MKERSGVLRLVYSVLTLSFSLFIVAPSVFALSFDLVELPGKTSGGRIAPNGHAVYLQYVVYRGYYTKVYDSNNKTMVYEAGPSHSYLSPRSITSDGLISGNYYPGSSSPYKAGILDINNGSIFVLDETNYSYGEEMNDSGYVLIYSAGESKLVRVTRDSNGNLQKSAPLFTEDSFRISHISQVYDDKMFFAGEELANTTILDYIIWQATINSDGTLNIRSLNTREEFGAGVIDVAHGIALVSQNNGYRLLDISNFDSPSLGSYVFENAKAVNSHGWVIGGAMSNAFVYTPDEGEMLLSDVISDDFLIYAVLEINDSGQILAWGKYPDSNISRSVVLTPSPVPAPSTFFLTASGISLLPWLRKRFLHRFQS